MENKLLNIKTAVILCGGRGTRLGALGNEIPKTLVKVQNKEIIWYILNHLKKNGFNHIILPLGYRGNQIKSFFKKITILVLKSQLSIPVFKQILEKGFLKLVTR